MGGAGTKEGSREGAKEGREGPTASAMGDGKL